MERYTPLGKAAAVIGVLVAGGGVAVAASALAGTDDSDVSQALAERLPKTKITAIDCRKIDGLCEVQARQNLFYVDRGARYLVIGRVYDMETKQDLTAARLLEMNPDMLLGGGVSSPDDDNTQASSNTAANDPEATSGIEPAALSALPANGAIVRGRGTQTLTVFSDFRCGYCKRLYETLETLDVKVVERPISILGTRSISEAVICSSSPRRALKDAYDGAAIAGGSGCDTSGLDANEAFAREHGFSGTPVIVRDDGAVVHGYRNREFLERWVEGAAS